MIAAERQRRILAVARSRGVVVLRDLVADLGVSEPTLRRDLSAMAEAGLLERTRGGARLPITLIHEPTYLEKVGEAGTEKEAIAAEAAGLIAPGDSILLGAGTTTLALAHCLRDIEELTVVTNSLLVVNALMAAPRIEVVVTGGILRRSIHALVGPGTEQTLAALRLSSVFLSGNGLTASRGLSTPNPLVAASDRALASAAERVVVLADHTKIGHETMCGTVPCSQIDILVTDGDSPPDELDRFRDVGIEVLVAGPMIESVRTPIID